MKLGTKQTAALLTAFKTNGVTGGKNADATWCVIDSLKRRGLLAICPRSRGLSVLTDEGRIIATSIFDRLASSPG